MVIESRALWSRMVTDDVTSSFCSWSLITARLDVISGGHIGVTVIPSWLISRDTKDGQAENIESHNHYMQLTPKTTTKKELCTTTWHIGPPDLNILNIGLSNLKNIQIKKMSQTSAISAITYYFICGFFPDHNLKNFSTTTSTNYTTSLAPSYFGHDVWRPMCWPEIYGKERVIHCW